jgi:hypothetical protein
MMNPQDSKPSKRQVTLEDLLRLKRAERPAPEFWARFEQELRAKQLAAIVAKRPWWRTLPETFAGLRRYQLPLGATAILAITFLSVREYRSNSPVATPSTVAEQPVQAVSPSPRDAGASAETTLVATASSISLVGNEQTHSGPTGTVPVQESNSPEGPQLVSAVSEGSSLSGMVAWLAGGETSEPAALSPAAQSIAANLEAAEQEHPELSRRLYGSSGGFEKRGLPDTRRPVDPLAQMRSPSDFHRARVLASALPVAARASGPGSERIAGRIADERLTEQEISRFGARGDRFLVKF